DSSTDQGSGDEVVQDRGLIGLISPRHVPPARRGLAPPAFCRRCSFFRRRGLGGAPRLPILLGLAWRRCRLSFRLRLGVRLYFYSDGSGRLWWFRRRLCLVG